MNYKRIYDELINNALNRASVKSKAAPGELETHHIVPKCIGGTNDTTNLVNLTTREHIIAHLLLAKIHGGKLVQAAMAMHMGRPLYKSSRGLAAIRSEFSKQRKEQMKGNTFGSYVWTPERKNIHKQAMSLVGYTDAKRKALEKAWAKNTGSKQTPESNFKRSNSMKLLGFAPVKAGDFKTCSNAGKANKGVKKSFRSESHSENWKRSFKQRYPIWEYEDQIREIWYAHDKPKVATLRKIATAKGIPEGHLGKMCANFFKQDGTK